MLVIFLFLVESVYNFGLVSDDDDFIFEECCVRCNYNFVEK